MPISKENITLLNEANNKVRDLSDFCHMWPEFKSLINESDIEKTDLPPEVIQLILRLYQLADHVCPGTRL